MNGEYLAAVQDRSCLADKLFGNGEGNDLDRRHHLAGFHRRMLSNGRDGDRRIDGVDAVHHRLVDSEDAGPNGVEIDAAGRGGPRLDAGMAHRLGKPRRRDILAEIVGG